MVGPEAVRKYRNVGVTTVSKEKLLLMLYDGAIGFARSAGERLATGDAVGFRERIGKCQAIVLEFLNTLDLRAGGEIAGNLQRIYLFLVDHLNEANLRLRGKNAEEAARILAALREGFDEAIRSLERLDRAAER
ncbi:MAG: flagellar export chaperone FliS [Deltaproteobacteria bacterium]